MAENGATDGISPPAVSQVGDPDERMTIRRELEIGMLLEIHVVEEADGAPEILVLAVAPCHVAKAGRDRLAVLPQAFAFDPLVEESSRLWRQRSLDIDGSFFRCGQFHLVPSVAGDQAQANFACFMADMGASCADGRPWRAIVQSRRAETQLTAGGPGATLGGRNSQ
jgi:hypothetical protein